MRTPRLYADTISHASGEVVLSERNHHYLARVLRAKVGQRVSLFNSQGCSTDAVITEINKRQTVVNLRDRTEHADQRIPVTLGMALIKSNRFHWTLQKATDLRVTSQTVVAHPATTSVTVDPLESTLLLIGPEGGFSDEEVETLLKKQVKPMSLGPRILRAETAAIVGLTLLGQQY